MSFERNSDVAQYLILQTEQTDVGNFCTSFLHIALPGSHHHSQDRTRAKDYVDLHDQVQVCYAIQLIASSLTLTQTSVSLLDNLETFLSTFQKDLAAVAGQISELQDRSKDIDNRLKSRKVCSNFSPS